MLELDEDAVVCDLAETYHIYDYRSLPPSQVATFVVGLGQESRIKMKLSGSKYPLNTLLLVRICDDLRMICYSKTKDAQKGINRPESLMNKLLHPGEDSMQNNPEGYMSFNSAQEYEDFMKRKRGE